MATSAAPPPPRPPHIPPRSMRHVKDLESSSKSPELRVSDGFVRLLSRNGRDTPLEVSLKQSELLL